MINYNIYDVWYIIRKNKASDFLFGTMRFLKSNSYLSGINRSGKIKIGRSFFS